MFKFENLQNNILHNQLSGYIVLATGGGPSVLGSYLAINQCLSKPSSVLIVTTNLDDSDSWKCTLSKIIAEQKSNIPMLDLHENNVQPQGIVLSTHMQLYMRLLKDCILKTTWDLVLFADVSGSKLQFIIEKNLVLSVQSKQVIGLACTFNPDEPMRLWPRKKIVHVGEWLGKLFGKLLYEENVCIHKMETNLMKKCQLCIKRQTPNQNYMVEDD